MNCHFFRVILWIFVAIGMPVLCSYSAESPTNNRPRFLQPILAVEPPSDPSGWSVNAIDCFIRAKHKERGLSSIGPAHKQTLIRRITFDLTGLPPTPDELRVFLADSSPDAWERIVDRLLASPRYRERWGRHWLDVVRYADTGGFETDLRYPNAWKYRDYIIRSLHADKPFDRLILAAKPAHARASAKHVIFLFMQGGPSHLDTFDPKPLLNKMHGQPLPVSVSAGRQLQFTKMDAAILGCPQSFRRCGRSGLEIADTYLHLQRCADNLAVVRSCYHASFNHAPAQYMLNTGFARMGKPCLGSWVSYGLGSESENLPSFVVLATTGDVKGGPPVYDRGFLRRYPDKRAGRDHNPYGFTTWLAGGGVKGGRIIGATDGFGFRAIEDRVHVNDLHATILRLLGLDHHKLTYLFEGRQQRLADVGGDKEFADRLIS